MASTGGASVGGRRGWAAVRHVVAAAAAAGLVAAGVWAATSHGTGDLPPTLPAPAEPVLPDLTLSTLNELYAGTGDDTGHAYLFFTAAIANVGRGPFLVHAVRAGSSSPWRVSQRFREQDGATSEHVVGGADLVWGGHGHNHWHVHLGASYELLSPAGEVLRSYEKVGFCFFDQLRLDPAPAFAQPRHFRKTTCSGAARNAVDMGLSPGWSDPYQWTLPDQRVDITGLEDGIYRLTARADPDDWFRESDEGNNERSVAIRLTTSVSPARVELLETSRR